MTDTAIATTTVYERLGGASGIEVIVEDVVEAHMHNPLIASRFLPYRAEPERLSVIKGHLCAFFIAGTGGPDAYEGRTMPEAHRGMNISAAEYIAAVDDILKTLEAHGIDEATQGEVLAIVYSLKDEMIGA